MSVLNNLFDKVFVLTIERNADRHPLVEKHLKGVDFEFWYGIDVPRVFPEATCVSQIPDDFFIRNRIDKSFVSAWTKGQLGAYTSIAKMIKEVQEKYEQVLIFEDDFIAQKEGWVEILQKAMKELPSDWEILLIGYLYYGKGYKLCYSRKLRWLFKFYNSVKGILRIGGVVKPTPGKYSSHLDKSGTGLGGHAYALSKKGAIRLMKYLDPMKESGDILIKKLIERDEIKAYSVYPCLFKQNEAFHSKTEVS